MAASSPRDIVSPVRAFIRRHGIFRPGPIVVAVSGGTDSTALALILAELREEFGLVLHVAHFDHRTRPRDAAKDAQYVAELANTIGAPIRVGRAQRAPKSEDEAREQRYAFLRRVAQELGATAIATGHTLDDQAETVLLHLTRGAGLAGAAGMRPLRDSIARPLLAIARAETTAICRPAKLKPREDPSNRSVRFARNRVRRNVLPQLAKINPEVRAALARFADAAADVEDRIALPAGARQTTHATEAAHATQTPQMAVDTPLQEGAATLDIADLPTDHALRDRVLSDWWRERGGRSLTARNRDALAQLVATTAGTRRLDLPGGSAIREYARLNYAPHGAVAKSSTTRDGGTWANSAEVRLARGRELTWHGWRITSDMASDGLPFGGRVDARTASKLTIRARRPGDRIGKRGKLQDVFVDAKVPVRQRDTWPVVTVEQDVIWVPGLTQPPDSGPVVIAAGPLASTPSAGEDVSGKRSQMRRVASMSEARRKGGKRGPR